MKVVTVHVDESEYEEFKRHARRSGQSASAQLRETIRRFNTMRRSEGQPSLGAPLPPASVGGIRETWKGREDLLGDFLDRL